MMTEQGQGGTNLSDGEREEQATQMGRREQGQDGDEGNAAADEAAVEDEESVEDMIADDEETIGRLISETDTDEGFVNVTSERMPRRRRPARSPAPGTSGGADQAEREEGREHTAAVTDEKASMLQAVQVPAEVLEYLASWKMFVGDVVSEMRSPTAPITTEVEDDGPGLNRHLLVKNFKRLRRALDPVIEVHHTVRRIIHWENPFTSGGVLVLYVVCAYFNLLLPVALGALLVFLFVQYLRRTREPHGPPTPVDEDDERGILEKARAVKEIMRKVQNEVGRVADGIERVQNLLLWRAPKQSAKVFFGAFAAFLLVLFTPQWIWLTLVKIVIGCKLLIQPGLYHNYPRLREKYDRNFISSLPTNTEATRIMRERGRIAAMEHRGTMSPASSASASPSRARARTQQQHQQQQQGSLTPLRHSSSTSNSAMASDVGLVQSNGTAMPSDDDSTRARSESLRKTQERSEGDALCDLGIPLSEQIIETNQCFYLPDRKLTNVRRGRLWVTDTFFCFRPSSRDDTGFCFHLSRLVKLERTGKVLGSRGLMVQLTFKDSNGQEVIKSLSGILNPTSLINAISKQQRLVAERTQSRVVHPT